MNATDERDVQAALEASGDVAGALLWRRICHELDGELRVGLCARDASSARRVLGRLPAVPGGSWVVVPLEADPNARVGLGAQDRLLGVHALLFATPMTAALGSTERDALLDLERAAAPARRAVTVADAHLLDRLSDDPDAERAAVVARVEELLPVGWPLIPADGLQAWLHELVLRREPVVAERKTEVARALIHDALSRSQTREAGVRQKLNELDRLLAAEDQALADARRRGRRIAAHTVAIIRRHTESLDLDLQAFLRALEADLPDQLLAVNASTARGALPHWLAAVVEGWMTDRLAAWRRDVLQELDEIEIDEVVRAELLVPALQPAAVRGEARWARRLASTAAFGGAAALLAFGMWVPGLVALAGGVVWSTFRRGEGDAADRERLTATARTALRQMGVDAQRLLGAQLAQMSAELERLADETGADAERERAELRAALTQRADEQRRALDDLVAAHARLTAALPELPA